MIAIRMDELLRDDSEKGILLIVGSDMTASSDNDPRE